MTRNVTLKFCATLAVSLAYGAPAQVPSNSASHDDFKFEVASIRLNTNAGRGPGNLEVLPDGIRDKGENTYGLLEVAFLPRDARDGQDASITKAPDWVISDRYDIDARVAEKDLKDWRTQTRYYANDSGDSYLRTALRNLLKDRYKLQAHLVETQIPYISIVAIDNHNKLVTVPDIPLAPEHAMKLPSGGSMTLARFFGCTMDDLASFITQQSGQLTQDKTGFKDRYNFNFTINRRDWAEDHLRVMEAIESLGIRLRSDKGHGRNLVIDHIERPQPD